MSRIVQWHYESCSCGFPIRVTAQGKEDCDKCAEKKSVNALYNHLQDLRAEYRQSGLSARFLELLFTDILE